MGGMGGMGGMYGGMPGQDPNDPNSLTNSFSQSTQATFQMIESIVGAFGGFAQMLESTYMATHSSFFGRPSSQAVLDIFSNWFKQWSRSQNNSATCETPSARHWASSPSFGGSEL